MSLKLMYITNNPDVAKIAESAGVDRIFVDMEYIGKSERQGGMDTVQSRHTLSDICGIKSSIKKAELLVRCNPIHGESDEFASSKQEIDSIIACGADIIMLPFFKTVAEVKTFVEIVNGRVKTMLLFETPESVELVDEILEIGGIDEVFIGLNDLSIGYGMSFMFELLADGTVEHLCNKFNLAQIPYGFGGIASIGKGMLPSEYIIKEHYRLGSGCAILSRSFCNTQSMDDLDSIYRCFNKGLLEIRDYESECLLLRDTWESNYLNMIDIIKQIAERSKS